MDHLHWRTLRYNASDNVGASGTYFTCLGHLWWRNINRNNPFAQGGQGKCCFMSLSLATTTLLSPKLRQCKHNVNNWDYLASKAGRKNDLSIAPNRFDELKKLTNSDLTIFVSCESGFSLFVCTPVLFPILKQN